MGTDVKRNTVRSGLDNLPPSSHIGKEAAGQRFWSLGDSLNETLVHLSYFLARTIQITCAFRYLIFCLKSKDVKQKTRTFLFLFFLVFFFFVYLLVLSMGLGTQLGQSDLCSTELEF